MGQNNYTNYTPELNLDIVYKVMPNEVTCSGEVEIRHGQGKAPFLYSVDGGKTFSKSAIFSGLCAQRYFVHVRDAEGKLGLDLVNLEVASVDESANTIDKSSEIEALTNELTNHPLGSLQYRKVQWRLCKLNVPQTAQVFIESSTENKIIYQLPVIFPDESQEANFEMNIDRVESLFPNIKIAMDYEKWKMNLQIENYQIDNSLEEVLSYFGFSAVEFKNN